MNNYFKDLAHKQRLAETNTITFNTNGGTSLNPLIVPRGIPIPSYRSNYLPSKQYNSFVAWYKDSELTTLWNDSIVSLDTTLYAK